MTDLARHSQTLGNRPALIIVDMINGFTDPKSPLGGSYPDILQANLALLNVFRENNLPVFFTKVVYNKTAQARVFRDRLPALNVLIPGSEWVKINPALSRRKNEYIIEKHWASGFFKTELAEKLQSVKADSLVVTGLTTSGCVRATTLDGLQHNYKVFIAREAVGDRNMDAHKANLFDLHAKYADVVRVQYITDHIKGLNHAP